MKTLILSLVLLMAGCSSEDESTPKCDYALGSGWGQTFGTEVEASANLDSDRCVQIEDVWCCAL